MAADLVESSDIPHTLHHDLESIFWVLLWIILTRVPTSWSDDARSSFINETMSPIVYSHTGGTMKSSWLTSESPLIEDKFKIPGNPDLCEFAAELLSTVSARYRVRPSTRPSSLNPFVLSGAKQKTRGTSICDPGLRNRVDIFEQSYLNAQAIRERSQGQVAP